MANRRMFSKNITNKGKFLRMAHEAQALYFHLGMNADDDGYAEWYTVLQMTGHKQQTLQVLQANGFVHVFDEDVLVVVDWKENNQIRKDRYTPSIHLEKYRDLALATNGQPDGNQVETQVRLGKDSIGKVSKGKKVFGELGKVKLTGEEHNKLIERFGEKNTNMLIFELDTYVASSGKKYKSHYATLLNWAKRKVVEQVEKQATKRRIV